MAALIRWYVAVVPGIDPAHAEATAAVECNAARRRSFTADIFFEKLFRIANNWCHSDDPEEYSRFLAALFHRIAAPEPDTMRFQWRAIDKIVALAEDDHMDAGVDPLPHWPTAEIAADAPVFNEETDCDVKRHEPRSSDAARRSPLQRPKLKTLTETKTAPKTKVVLPFEAALRVADHAQRLALGKKATAEPEIKAPKACELALAMPMADGATATSQSERLRRRVRKTLTRSKPGAVEKPLPIVAGKQRQLVAEAIDSINWAGILLGQQQASTAKAKRSKPMRGKTAKKGRRKQAMKTLRKAKKAAAVATAANPDPLDLIEAAIRTCL